jgi:hypothetical protein
LPKPTDLPRQSTSKELFERLKDKPFWIWDKEQHMQEYARTDGDCCFNHIIGLPTKEAIEKPMFDYEKIPYDFWTILMALVRYTLQRKLKKLNNHLHLSGNIISSI